MQSRATQSYILIYWDGQNVHLDFSIRCYRKTQMKFLVNQVYVSILPQIPLPGLRILYALTHFTLEASWGKDLFSQWRCRSWVCLYKVTEVVSDRARVQSQACVFLKSAQFWSVSKVQTGTPWGGWHRLDWLQAEQSTSLRHPPGQTSPLKASLCFRSQGPALKSRLLLRNSSYLVLCQVA